MHKPSLLSGSICAMLAVILGAFGAHYLKTIFSPEILTSFETGVRYQFYHAFALLLLGVISTSLNKQAIKTIYYFFFAGIFLFSGSIYLLCILKANGEIGLSGLGILTPIGGLCFIGGWLRLIIAVWQMKSLK